MNLYSFADLIAAGKERDTKDRLYLRWATMYQNTCNFDEFVASCQPPKKQSSEEILKEVDSYLEQFSYGVEKVEI